MESTGQHNIQKQILRASYGSIIGNGVLSAAKLVAGAVSGSSAVVSDGIDSASDVAVSAVIAVTAKIMEKRPNARYAYGYAKAESIATKILSMVIFFAGGQMLFSAVGHLISKEPREMPGMIAVYVTAASIICKLLLSLYQSAIGRRTGSSMQIK